MGFIGNEIVQSRVYLDPSAKKENPNLNYRHTFPITVFDAVRDSMDDEDSQTLREVLNSLRSELAKKQTIVPALPTNYLMTYAGVAGQVDKIEISHKISWDASQRTHGRIPTEKAVGDLLQSVGLLDGNGQAVDPGTQTIQWTQILGRPNTYHALGDNDDGFVTQDVITKAFRDLQSDLDLCKETISDGISDLQKQLDQHLRAENPHGITLEMLGGVSSEELQKHLHAENPHGITASTLGLDLVDNTSDYDKPISRATQAAIDSLMAMIRDVANNAAGSINALTNLKYNRTSGKLVASYYDGSELIMDIPINGLIDDVRFDRPAHTLQIYELSGARRDLDLSSLYNAYLGSVGDAIDITIDPADENGKSAIRAKLKPGSITQEMLSPDIVLGGGEGTGDFEFADGCVTTPKLADLAVTAAKIADHTITADKLVIRSITGQYLFRATQDNQVLITKRAGDDPVWSSINGELIDSSAIQSRHIANWAIGTDKIEDKSITHEKLANDAVDNDKIIDNCINGSKLVWNIKLMGTPTITSSPLPDAAAHEIADVIWVRNYFDSIQVDADHIANRSVYPSKIVPSSSQNQVLATLNPLYHPSWTKIIRDLIEDRAIGSDQIDDDAIQTKHVTDGSITSEKIFPSHIANRVLAAVEEDGHPVYTQITREMLGENLIGAAQLAPGSVELSKLQPSEENDRVLGTFLKGSPPTWMQINSRMIEEGAITAKHLFTPEEGKMVLTFNEVGQVPKWTKILQGMIGPDAVDGTNIQDGSILPRHLAGEVFGNEHLQDRSITGIKLAMRTVGSDELFSSPEADRVLAVPNLPYERPQWTQVTGPMIADGTITVDKIKTSPDSYRVIGVKEGGTTPEYLKISGDFFEDKSIASHKLIDGIVLSGTPTLASTPRENASAHELVDAAWVRNFVMNYVGSSIDAVETCGCIDMTEEEVDRIWGGTIGDGSLPGASVLPRSITGEHLFSSDTPGILAVLQADQDPVWTTVTKELMGSESVGSDQLEADIMLRGLPTLETRPPENASDEAGIGSLIPDCQWVLDQIRSAVKNLSGGCCGGNNSSSSNWQEILDEEMLAEWLAGGMGSLETTDPYEITDEQVVAEWNAGGMDDITADEYEIPYETIEEIWNNPGNSVSGNLGNWIELPKSRVEDTWASGGAGSLDSDSGEISDRTMQAEWADGGSGDTVANVSEITKWTVDQEWAGNATGSTDVDPNPGAFPGTTIPSSGGTGSGGTIQYICNCGEATSLKGEDIVQSEHIAPKAVTARNLFTTMEENCVLAVIEKAGEPRYTKIQNAMFEDGTIDPCKLMGNLPNHIIGTNESGQAGWMQLSGSQIADKSITAEKLADRIDASILDFSSLDLSDMLQPDSVQEVHLRDAAVTGQKLAEGAVDNDKIVDATISGEKLREEIVLPRHASVEAHTDYERRSLHNMVISPNAPKYARNGDIWFRYY